MRLLKLLLACGETSLVYRIAKRWENSPKQKRMLAARGIQKDLAKRGYHICKRCSWAMPPGTTHDGPQGCNG